MRYVSHANLGGQLDHGVIVPQSECDPLRAAWEARVLGLTLATGGDGAWSIDMSPAARETLPGYGRLSHYEIWLAGLELRLRQPGMLDRAENAASISLRALVAVPRVLAAVDMEAMLARGAPTARPATTPPRQQEGDRVRARTDAMNHHTHSPDYAHGKCAWIAHSHGMHVFADANTHGLGERPQWLYTLVLGAVDLQAKAARSNAVLVNA